MNARHRLPAASACCLALPRRPPPSRSGFRCLRAHPGPMRSTCRATAAPSHTTAWCGMRLLGGGAVCLLTEVGVAAWCCAASGQLNRLVLTTLPCLCCPAGGAAAGAGASGGAPALWLLSAGMKWRAPGRLLLLEPACPSATRELHRSWDHTCTPAPSSPPPNAQQPEALASDLSTIASNAVAFNGERDVIAEDAAALAAYLSAVLAGQVRWLARDPRWRCCWCRVDAGREEWARHAHALLRPACWPPQLAHSPWLLCIQPNRSRI